MLTAGKKLGFTLVEILIVVAIMGIFAAMAIPNYQKSSARARMTSAKGMLSKAFLSQKSFFAEYATYHASMPNTGFMPEGYGNPLLSWGQAKEGASKIYYSIFAAPNCDLDTDNSPMPVTLASLGLRGPSGYVNSAVGIYWATWDVCDNPGTTCGYLTAPWNTAAITTSTFKIQAIGCPRFNLSLTADVFRYADFWQVDQNGVFTNLNNGL